jgi:SAM-dependent methyltransferase
MHTPNRMAAPYGDGNDAFWAERAAADHGDLTPIALRSAQRATVALRPSSRVRVGEDGQMPLDPVAVEADLTVYYDQEGEARSTRPLDPRRVEGRSSFVGSLGPSSRVLEIGSGPGRDADAFRTAGHDYVAIDLSIEHARRCRSTGANVARASVRQLPFPDGVFDAVWSMSTLMHVPNSAIDGALTAIARVLARGGVAAIGVWGGADIEDHDQSSPPRLFSRRSDARWRSMLAMIGDIEAFDTWGDDDDFRYQWAIVRRRDASERSPSSTTWMPTPHSLLADHSGRGEGILMVRVLKAIALTALVSVAMVMAPGGVAAAATAPTMTISPDVDLVDGQTVAVTGAGFNPGEPYALGTCRAQLPSSCGSFTAPATADANGEVSTTYVVRRNPNANPVPYTCDVSSCVVVIIRITQGFGGPAAGIWFRSSSGDVSGRDITLTQSTGLTSGQTIGVSGASFYTGYVGLSQCAIDASGQLICGPGFTHADVDGSFSTTVTVQQTFVGGVLTASGVNGTATVDCNDPTLQSGGCFVAAAQGAAFGPTWMFVTKPIRFVTVATSKDDCKDGGWQTVVDADHDAFANQGDCVSFVASDGRNAARD